MDAHLGADGAERRIGMSVHLGGLIADTLDGVADADPLRLSRGLPAHHAGGFTDGAVHGCVGALGAVRLDDEPGDLAQFRPTRAARPCARRDVP